MATLNQIGTSIINELNQPNNHELLERVKDRAKFLLSTILKRNIDKYGINDTIIIPMKFELEKIKLPVICDNLYTNNKCYIYQTINKIPTSVISNYSPIFNYIGSFDTVLPFYFTKEFNIRALKTLPIFSKTIFATIVNNKIRVYGNNHIKYIQVNMPLVDDTHDISGCKNKVDCYSDDSEFIAPLDIVDSIIRTLVDEFIKINNPQSNYEVKLDNLVTKQ